MTRTIRPAPFMTIAVALALSLPVLLLQPGCGGRDNGSISDAAAENGAPGSAAGKREGGPPADGRWHRVPGGQQGTPGKEQQEEMARLEAIGYLTGSRDPGDHTGVTQYRHSLAGQGHNLYTSGHGPEAVLIDMAGRELHRWRYPCSEVWPSEPGIRPDPDVTYWRNVWLFPNGDLLAIFEGQGIIKIDRDSNLLWASRCGAHHDLDLLGNGDILVLTRQATINPLVSSEKPILEDFITTLDSNGLEKHSVSLLECFANVPQFEAIWKSSENKTGDIFHTNTLFLLRDPPSGAPPAFAVGRVLTSMKSLDAVAVVDLVDEKVVWARKGRFKAQHDPRLLANGNMLLYDNCGIPSCSRVLELDLENWRPVWSFRGTPEHPFYSETCGVSQRLGNGNTLVTESDGGRAFEVTPDGEIVWEFRSPHRAGDQDQFIATLFVVKRLESGFPLDWIDRSPP